MGETTTEGSLIQTWAFLSSGRLLAMCRAFGGIPPPPRGGFGRLQIIQPLPFLGGYQDNRLVPGPRDGYRTAASLYLIRGCGQALGVVRLLIAHNSQYGGSIVHLTNARAER